MTGRVTRAGVVEGLARLERSFGRPRLGTRHRPLDELILTVLSQNTTDRNSDRAYDALRRRFRSWKRVMSAPPGEVEASIRVGGLARTKTRVIQSLLRQIRRERGSLSLDFLRRLPVDEARRYLSRFKGVGAKTVHCVLLFSCGRPVFPVDTHIHRVATRLGWVPASPTRDRSHEILGRLVPPRYSLSGHINLIRLGRRLCRPRNPACRDCPLSGRCRYARARVRPRRPAATL
ncbi:MAG: endonuclease III domain-containing protein [Acidobacteriota bacterium]